MGKRGPKRRYRSLELGCRKVDGHWLWQGAVGTRGQCVGRDPATGKTGSVHRILWKQMRGELDDYVYIDQTCGVFRCVNPWHFEVWQDDRNSGMPTTERVRQRGMIANAQTEALLNNYPFSNTIPYQPWDGPCAFT